MIIECSNIRCTVCVVAAPKSTTRSCAAIAAGTLTAAIVRIGRSRTAAVVADNVLDIELRNVTPPLINDGAVRDVRHTIFKHKTYVPNADASQVTYQ